MAAETFLCRIKLRDRRAFISWLIVFSSCLSFFDPAVRIWLCRHGRRRHPFKPVGTRKPAMLSSGTKLIGLFFAWPMGLQTLCIRVSAFALVCVGYRRWRGALAVLQAIRLLISLPGRPPAYGPLVVMMVMPFWTAHQVSVSMPGRAFWQDQILNRC
jgi:hypothetical protein